MGQHSISLGALSALALVTFACKPNPSTPSPEDSSDLHVDSSVSSVAESTDTTSLLDGSALTSSANTVLLDASNGGPSVPDAADMNDAGFEETDATVGSTEVQSSNEPNSEPEICEPSAPTECPTPAPRWGDIEPIAQQRCGSCHYGAVGGPWQLTTYQQFSDWQGEIRGALLDCSMPPPEDAIYMTDDERLAVLTWIRCGLPE